MSFIEKALEKTRLAGGPSASLAAPRIPSIRNATDSIPPVAAQTPTRRVALDFARLAAAGMLPPPEFKRRHAAQLRAVKRQLLKAVRKDYQSTNKVIMVTSSLASEGKSFSSLNLALSMAAEKDFRVLLVDGDVAKPRMSSLFGLSGDLGLLDAALDPRIDVESLIVGTDLPGLDVLCAGGRTTHATESLASSRMRDVVAQLAAVQNRVILIDSPPLLITTEAAALAQHAGQVVIVVRANSTPERAVVDSIKLLGERDGVSLLLNDVTESGLDTLYYGYGQDYGEWQAEDYANAAAPASGNVRDA